MHNVDMQSRYRQIYRLYIYIYRCVHNNVAYAAVSSNLQLQSECVKGSNRSHLQIEIIQCCRYNWFFFVVFFFLFGTDYGLRITDNGWYGLRFFTVYRGPRVWVSCVQTLIFIACT